LQLLLLLAWPFSQLAGWLQRRHTPRIVQHGTANYAMSRRTFLSTAAALPPLAMAGINTVGALDAEFRAVLRRIEFAYPNLPAKLDGLKIAHMTDVHLGSYISASKVQKLAALLHAESPDLLAITGDFVDDVSLLPDTMARLKPFLASLPLGAWFCMGNHEHLRGAAPIRKILQENGIKILDNQHQRISFHGEEFSLLGVDYPMSTSITLRPEAVHQFLTTACANVPEGHFTLLMAHHPDFLPAAFERRIDLTLAGHTHGGQVGWGKRSALQFLYPYMRGVYRSERSFGFVSSGGGHWLPFRLNCPPEVSLLTMKKSAG
jgi:predicted MPP superfamily phosphohydrolase